MKKFSELCARPLKGALSLAFASALLTSSALAQVPSASPPPFQPSTFAGAATFTAPVTGAGDLFCVTGSASRLVKVKAVRVSGTDTTAQTAVFNLIKRSVADTGGTSTTPTAVPLDTTQILTAATATLAAYTVIPTPGAAVGNVGAQAINLATSGAGSGVTWSYLPTELYSDLRLRGIAQQLCVNAPNAFSTAAPSMSIEVIWTEQ